MKEFKKNHCRLCEEVFCCVECREKHEKFVHDLDYPDCDICVFGKTYILNPSEKLLEHIKQSHWPLNCVVCKTVYDTIEELLSHNKCEVPPPTPNTALIVENLDYDSPPITNLTVNKKFLHVISSTPMQDNILKIMQECSGENTSSDISKIDLKSPIDKKVTFCITPSLEKIEEKDGNDVKKYISTPGSTPGTDYYSVTEEEGKENETLWESAINSAEIKVSTNDSNIFKVTPIIDKFTPISMNLKKRKKQNLFDMDSPKNVIIKEEVAEKSGEEKSGEEKSGEEQNIFASTKLAVSQSDLENENKDDDKKMFNSKKDISEIKNISKDKDGLWSSMSRIVKNVVGLSQDFCNVSLKRSHSESEVDFQPNPEPKRYKFSIRGRKPIRDILYQRLPNSEDRILRQLSYEDVENNVFVGNDAISKETRFYFNNKVYVDKATQTD